MAALKWHSQLETGNKLVDSDHKQLLLLLGACIESSQRNATREELIVLSKSFLIWRSGCVDESAWV